MAPPRVVLRIGPPQATDTQDHVYVAVVTDVHIRKSYAKVGSTYGLPYGHVLGMKHLINKSNLENVQLPSAAQNTVYWQRWIDFKMTDEYLENLIQDLDYLRDMTGSGSG
jgi:hypothetical protein